MIPEEPNTPLIDPDPFTVVSLAVASASLLLQFVQTATAPSDETTSGTSDLSQREVRLTNLSNELDAVTKLLDRVQRAIERGSKNADKEFYDTKFGVSLGVVKLEFNHHVEFSQRLNELAGKMGALSIWANQIIREDAQMAALLGHDLMIPAASAAASLNHLMASGATNRQVLAEARNVLNSCRSALNRRLDNN